MPGSPNPAQDVGDPATGAFMLASGFALAGSSYATTGWAIHEALPDQIAVLDAFAAQFGTPAKTIAWGHSLGGIITAGLIQNYPDRFDAALPMCGVLSGGVATWNTALDAEFAFQTLIAPGSGLQLVNITNPEGNLGIAEGSVAGCGGDAAGSGAFGAGCGAWRYARMVHSAFAGAGTHRFRGSTWRIRFSGTPMLIFRSCLRSAPNWKRARAAILRGIPAWITASNCCSRRTFWKCWRSTRTRD